MIINVLYSLFMIKTEKNNDNLHFINGTEMKIKIPKMVLKEASTKTVLVPFK